jgi:uroporphyrinogen III methyltransferase/synthase
LAQYQGLILTSANGVAAFFERLRAKDLDLRALAGVEIIAVGPKTAQAIAEYGLKPDLIPVDYRAEGVLAELLARGVEGQRFLYPRTEIARELLPTSLREAGALVDAPVVYRTIAPRNKSAMIRHLLAESELDAICFSSSSTFDNLYALFGDELEQLQGRAAFFSIGPLTSKTIRKHGFKVALEPRHSTLDDLVAAMVDYYKTS